MQLIYNRTVSVYNAHLSDALDRTSCKWQAYIHGIQIVFMEKYEYCKCEENVKVSL
jgi:hypothetical protein